MDDDYRKAMNAALKSVSIKFRHSTEIKGKLSDLGYNEAVIKRVIQELKRLGYVDDKDWIECFVRSCTAKKFGRHAIFQKLSQKGIPKEGALEIVDKHQTDDKQKKLIETLLNTRYRSKDLKDFRERQKVAAGLARKGFSFSLIQEVLENASSES